MSDRYEVVHSILYLQSLMIQLETRINAQMHIALLTHKVAHYSPTASPAAVSAVPLLG
jgi:hypothetical protein